MNSKQADKLVEKTMLVILSCQTLAQLNNASRYASLAYEKLSKEVGLVNNSRFISKIERSIGFAQCNIKKSELMGVNND